MQMIRHFGTFLLFLTLLPAALNAQFLGGYFHGSRIGGTDCSFKLTTYTDSASGLNHCLAPVEVWNSTGTVLLRRDTLARVNGPLGSCDSLTGSGEYLGDGVLRNVYQFDHTFAGPGNYLLRFVGDTFHPSIMNIAPGQQAELGMVVVVNPFLGDDVGPRVLSDSVLNACIAQDEILDDVWSDIDGDSLDFRLVSPPGISGYSPLTAYADSFQIDGLNGTIHLKNPNNTGRFLYEVQCNAYRGGNFIGTVWLLRCLSVTDTCAVSIDDPLVDPTRVLVFPNPATETFELRLPPGIASCRLRMMDLTGKVMIEEMDYFQGSGAIKMGSLPAGVYLVEVLTRGRTEVIKLIKKQ